MPCSPPWMRFGEGWRPEGRRAQESETLIINYTSALVMVFSRSQAYGSVRGMDVSYCTSFRRHACDTHRLALVII